jgi:hypothetical protein
MILAARCVVLDRHASAAPLPGAQIRFPRSDQFADTFANAPVAVRDAAAGLIIGDCAST